MCGKSSRFFPFLPITPVWNFWNSNVPRKESHQIKGLCLIFVFLSVYISCVHIINVKKQLVMSPSTLTDKRNLCLCTFKQIPSVIQGLSSSISSWRHSGKSGRAEKWWTLVVCLNMDKIFCLERLGLPAHNELIMHWIDIWTIILILGRGGPRAIHTVIGRISVQ